MVILLILILKRNGFGLDVGDVTTHEYVLVDFPEVTYLIERGRQIIHLPLSRVLVLGLSYTYNMHAPPHRTSSLSLGAI